MTSSANTNVTNSASNAECELPPILQPGGLVDQVPQRTEPVDRLGGRPGAIKRRILEDLPMIRHDYLRSPSGASLEDNTPDKRYDRALYISTESTATDAVLRYCIA